MSKKINALLLVGSMLLVNCLSAAAVYAQPSGGAAILVIDVFEPLEQFEPETRLREPGKP